MAAIKNDLEQSFNRKIDLEGSVNSLNEINEEATQLQARNLELENQLRSVQKRISVTDNELGMLKTKYDDDVGRLTKQTEQLSEELKQKVKQVESLEIFKRKQEAEGNDVRILVETIADVTEQLSNVKNEAKDLRKIKNQFAAFIMKLDKVLDMVQREDIEMVTEDMLEEEDLEGSVNNSAVSENSSTVFNRFIEILSNQRLQLMNLQNVSSLTKYSDDLSNEIQTLKNSCSSLEATKQSWLRKRDTLTSEINKLESDISELEIALKEATEQVEKERLSLETEQTILKESLDEMEVENKKLRQQIEESKVRLEALEFESEELQQKMELVQDRQKKSGSSAKSSIETDSVMSPSTITDPDMLREMLRSEQDKTAELYIVIEDMKLQLQQRQSHSRPRPSASAISHSESAEESVHHDSLASDSILDERISSVRDSYIDDSVNYPHANEIEDQADEIVELKSRMAMLQDEIKKRDEELLKKEQMVSRLEELVFEVSKNNNGSRLRDEEEFQSAQMEIKEMNKSEIEESVVDGLIEAIQMNDETLNQTQEMIQLMSPVSGQGSKLPPVESMVCFN
ncbi:hypothetical protein BKA69DRAFT_920441 [Paraphysoderma sedebokerense]|nr:hypothetical protein BKA69DRAFT_920441 [Paraphysoderma sedebokerense]